MSNCQYVPDEYIIVGKVYSIIQYLPLEIQMKIIFAWLASEGNKSELIYDQFDDDESLRVYIDLVKEILTYYDYDEILEQLEELRGKKDANVSS